jgi:hypothetical protein
VTTRRASNTLALLAFLAAAGCARTAPFVYKPGGPAAGVTALPARLAVLPFEDTTEPYEMKGSRLNPDGLWFNLSRGGIGGVIEPVTAPLWARSFAQELAASGRFRAVSFRVEAAEVVDEDYVVSGALAQADIAGAPQVPSSFELRLAAARRQDGRRVWERTITRSILGDKKEFEGCGSSLSCINERSHAFLNRVLAGMFDEAGADLARSIGGRPGAAAGPAPGSMPAAGEPVDETIRKILEGK